MHLFKVTISIKMVIHFGHIASSIYHAENLFLNFGPLYFNTGFQLLAYIYNQIGNQCGVDSDQLASQLIIFF